ncbi:hypothetical protein V8J88_03905 [Massilia sp. W12]
MKNPSPFNTNTLRAAASAALAILTTLVLSIAALLYRWAARKRK